MKLLYGFHQLGEIHMWFATVKGFAMVAAANPEVPEVPDEHVLSDYLGGDADKIIELFFLEGEFELQSIENCADGCSLEFRCHGPPSIEELDRFALKHGFIDDPKYKKHVAGDGET